LKARRNEEERGFTMLEFQFDGAFDEARTMPATKRSTCLLCVGAAALVLASALATPGPGARWMTLSAADSALAYASVASQAACLAAETDPTMICVSSGGDVRSPVAISAH
jgi:hypothetical protein